MQKPLAAREHAVHGVERRRISVLGATGSVGTSTADVLAANPQRFAVEALIANSNAAELAVQARRLGARIAVVADDEAYRPLQDALSGTGIIAAAGQAAVLEAASRPVDIAMAAIVGTAGLAPTLAAMRAGADVALANKECLVTAGGMFMREAARLGRAVIPVDSEHSAIFQVLAGCDITRLERIILTASGGPFRTWTLQAMNEASPQQALRHPNWSMGVKISIDSATMMNKGLELIEAHHLFSLPAEQIDVLVHPESAIHGLVEFCDGSMLAQLGAADMRTPIAVALAWPRRMAAKTKRLDLVALKNLTFEAPDPVRFPALRLAREALVAGGAFTAVLNAANEVAVDAFVSGRIGFGGIVAIVADTMDWAQGQASGGADGYSEDLAAIVALDEVARRHAERLVTSTSQVKG